jgi:hypothetical protein
MAFIAEQQKRERDEKTATPPTASKRQKKVCLFALEKRRAENGATHVQMIRPDEETPHLDRKLEGMIDAVTENDTVISLELQVCTVCSCVFVS